jgi:hypothetical protein
MALAANISIVFGNPPGSGPSITPVIISASEGVPPKGTSAHVNAVCEAEKVKPVAQLLRFQLRLNKH